MKFTILDLDTGKISDPFDLEEVVKGDADIEWNDGESTLPWKDLVLFRAEYGSLVPFYEQEAGQTPDSLKQAREYKELKDEVVALRNVRNVINRNLRQEMENHQKCAMVASRYREALENILECVKGNMILSASQVISEVNYLALKALQEEGK